MKRRLQGLRIESQQPTSTQPADYSSVAAAKPGVTVAFILW